MCSDVATRKIVPVHFHCKELEGLLAGARISSKMIALYLIDLHVNAHWIDPQ